MYTDVSVDTERKGVVRVHDTCTLLLLIKIEQESRPKILLFFFSKYNHAVPTERTA